MLNDVELGSYWFYKLQSYWLLQASTLFSFYYNRYNVCIMDMHAYMYTDHGHPKTFAAIYST